jgi:hypothetical protein
VTDRRVFGVDYGRRILASLLISVGLAIGYLALFVTLLPPIISVNAVLPLPVLVGLFPFVYFVVKLVRPQFSSAPRTVISPKFEILKEQILEIAIQKPGTVRGWGRLVIRLKSAGFMEFRLVGGRQFRHVKSLMKQFCSGTGIQLVDIN